jgi:hypothetical protein
MFTFFHRRNKIVLDCFTSDAGAFNYTPIVKAIKTVPDWWKSLPNPGSGTAFLEKDEKPGKHQNMKRCYGFIELYKRGFILEHWCDVNIGVEYDNVSFSYSTGSTPVSHHPSQYNNSFKDFQHLKLNSPWSIREKTGVKFMWIGASWSFEDLPITIMPGIFDFKYQSATNCNMFFPKSNERKEFMIKIGQPLMHGIPLSDDNIEIRNHLVTEEEYKRILIYPVSFSGFYNGMNILKRNEERNRGKCPFPFFGDKK